MGITLASHHKQRVHELCQLEHSLMYISGELRYRQSVLADVFGQAAIRSGDVLKQWFLTLQSKLSQSNDTTVQEAWSEAMLPSNDTAVQAAWSEAVLPSNDTTVQEAWSEAMLQSNDTTVQEAWSEAMLQSNDTTVQEAGSETMLQSNDTSVQEAWSESIHHLKEISHLKNTELLILESIGGMLGCVDLDTQVKEFELVTEQLHDVRTTAEHNLANKMKVTVSLCIVATILLVILCI